MTALVSERAHIKTFEEKPLFKNRKQKIFKRHYINTVITKLKRRKLSAQYLLLTLTWTRFLAVTRTFCDWSSEGIMATPLGKKRGLEHLDAYEPKPAKHLQSLHDRMAERRLVVILEGASLETVKVKRQSCVCVLLSCSPYLLQVVVTSVTVPLKQWSLIQISEWPNTLYVVHLVYLPGRKILWAVKLWPTQKYDRQKRKESWQHKTRYHTSGNTHSEYCVQPLYLCLSWLMTVPLCFTSSTLKSLKKSARKKPASCYPVTSRMKAVMESLKDFGFMSDFTSSEICQQKLTW